MAEVVEYEVKQVTSETFSDLKSTLYTKSGDDYTALASDATFDSTATYYVVKKTTPSTDTTDDTTATTSETSTVVDVDGVEPTQVFKKYYWGPGFSPESENTIY